MKIYCQLIFIYIKTSLTQILKCGCITLWYSWTDLPRSSWNYCRWPGSKWAPRHQQPPCWLDCNDNVTLYHIKQRAYRIIPFKSTIFQEGERGRQHVSLFQHGICFNNVFNHLSLKLIEMIFYSNNFRFLKPSPNGILLNMPKHWRYPSCVLICDWHVTIAASK